jgi:radical SAM-linked protein
VADLTHRLKKMSRAQLNLGVAHFTPKAHTPFQWHPGSTAAAISDRLYNFRDIVKTPGLTPKWNAPGASWVESLLARGDRRLAKVLERVYRAGARFEAWGDRFDPDLWIKALAEENLAEELFLTPYTEDENLPYQHLDAGLTKDFLRGELAKAKKAETTTDCRFDKCHNCGACEKGLSIDLAQPQQAEPALINVPQEIASSEKPAGPGAVFLLNFKKLNRAAYLGHLELVELFKRAFRRAGISLAMSEGFHPQPKISFLTALPLGIASEDEYVRVVATKILGADDVAARLGAALPPDIVIKGARLLSPHKSKVQPQAVTWRVSARAPIFTPGAPPYPEAVLEYVDKKGKNRRYELAEFVMGAAADDERTARISINLGLSGTPKPIPALLAMWGLEARADDFDLVKTETILDRAF